MKDVGAVVFIVSTLSANILHMKKYFYMCCTCFFIVSTFIFEHTRATSLLLAPLIKHHCLNKCAYKFS